jgi:hypothetical protein
MWRSLAAASLLVAARATAQVTPYHSSEAPAANRNPDKLVCKKEEQIGSRLGAKKVCLTVREWEARAKDGRDQTERVQSGTPVCSNPPCPGEPF